MMKWLLIIVGLLAVIYLWGLFTTREIHTEIEAAGAHGYIKRPSQIRP